MADRVTDRMVDAAMDALLIHREAPKRFAVHAAVEAALRERALQAMTDAGQEIEALLAQPAPDFCDTHCTWLDHAPGCVRAEPAPEPVAWTDPDMLGILTSDERDALIRNQGSADNYTVPLYTHPQQDKLREAGRTALEALEKATESLWHEPSAYRYAVSAINALREALK